MQDGDENNNDVDIRYIVAAVESQGKQSTIRTCWRTVSKLSQCQNCIIREKSGCLNNLAEILGLVAPLVGNLLLGRLVLDLGSVQNLQEVRGLCPHSERYKL